MKHSPGGAVHLHANRAVCKLIPRLILFFLVVFVLFTVPQMMGIAFDAKPKTKTSPATYLNPAATSAPALSTTTLSPSAETPPPVTATAPPLTGLPKDLKRWETFAIPADWMECVRRNLQLDAQGRPLHAVMEMSRAIPLLITPLTSDVRFFPFFICSVDVPVRYHLIIQNGEDPETVVAINEMERRFGDSGRLLVVRNHHNRGYSGSMNQGFEWALRARSMAEVPWVFACGVDTIFESGLLASLVRAVKENTQNDAAMMAKLAEEVQMEERLVQEGNFSYYEKWAPRGRPLKVLRSGASGVPLNVRTASLLPDRVRYLLNEENRVNGSFTPAEMKQRYFSGYVASVTPIPYAVGTVAITRLALSTVGFFDENYFPAYMDDIDMRWRHFHFGFSTIFAENYGTVRRWHHYNAPNLRGGGPFADPVMERYGTENNYSRRAFGWFIQRSKGLYDRLKHGPRDPGGVWRHSVENGTYRYTRFNVSYYPADTWVLDSLVQECMFRHTYNYTLKTWKRPSACAYDPLTLERAGVLGTEQLAEYRAVVEAGLYLKK